MDSKGIVETLMGVRAGVCLGEEAWGLVNYRCMVDDQIKNWYLRHACISTLLKGRTYICNVRTPYIIIILFGRRAPKKDSFFFFFALSVPLFPFNMPITSTSVLFLTL